MSRSRRKFPCRRRDRWAPVRYSRDVGLVYVDRLPEVGHPNRVYTLFGERTVWRWCAKRKRWDDSVNPDYVWAEYEVVFVCGEHRNPNWVLPVIYRSENTQAATEEAEAPNRDEHIRKLSERVFGRTLRGENTPAAEPGSLTFAQIQSAAAAMKKFEVDLGSPMR